MPAQCVGGAGGWNNAPTNPQIRKKDAYGKYFEELAGTLFVNINGKGTRAMRFRRGMAALYLIVYGVLGLSNLPVIQRNLIGFLQAACPSITWRTDPFSLAHAVLCPAAVLAAVNIFRGRRWALWLGAGILLAELPFAAHVIAWDFWYEQCGVVLDHRMNAHSSFSSTQDGPNLMTLVKAYSISAGFTALLVAMLSPWKRQISKKEGKLFVSGDRQ